MAPQLRRHAPVLSVMLLSIAAWAVVYRLHLVTVYNDGMSHLNIARMVVDSKQPGLAQLGSVWLPLNQLLYLPLVWNTWAWHSGFAGSAVSMVSFVAAVIGAYYAILELTGKRLGGFIGAAALALNLNFLYLQATPLTEPVFLATFMLAALFLIKYLKTHNTAFLVAASLFTALQVAGRYDGWFVAIAASSVITFYEYFVHKISAKATAGLLGLYLAPVAFTMGLWFLWNYLLFGNPLYSFIGPYSAHAQQEALRSHSSLITEGSPWQSVRAFALAAKDNIGSIVSILGIAGWITYLATGRGKVWAKGAALALLMSAIIFNVIALFLGFSILNVPEMHWNPSHTPVGTYFNVRYGITALPFIAVGYGLLAGKARAIAAALAAAILVQAGSMFRTGVITVQDGTIGSSSFANQDIAEALHRLVGKSQTVILSTSYYNAAMFESGLDLKQFIYEGVNREWKAAIARPQQFAQWVVMANGNIGDPVYTSLVLQGKSGFHAMYKLAYAGRHANVYELKAPNDMYVTADGSRLSIGGKPFFIEGANDYDLAYQDKAAIDATFKQLKAAGINTVRLWFFGDGAPEGFQPSAGQLNESRLKTADYILAEAHAYHLRLIPTLTNNWADYGGMDQYLSWAGLPAGNHDAFYTDPAVIRLYENYLNHILSRKNSITGTAYADDPSVLAWDIANEPRVSANTDARVVSSWADTIARYVQGIDDNHLVTVSLDDGVLDAHETDICSSRSIGFCSAHLYPTERGDPTAVYTSFGQEQARIQKIAQASQSVHKPVVMTEIGIDKSAPIFNQTPLQSLGSALGSIASDHYGGWVVWNWSQTADSSYGFSPRGTNGMFSARDLAALARRGGR